MVKDRRRRRIWRSSLSRYPIIRTVWLKASVLKVGRTCLYQNIAVCSHRTSSFWATGWKAKNICKSGTQRCSMVSRKKLAMGLQSQLLQKSCSSKRWFRWNSRWVSSTVAFSITQRPQLENKERKTIDSCKNERIKRWRHFTRENIKAITNPVWSGNKTHRARSARYIIAESAETGKPTILAAWFSNQSRHHHLLEDQISKTCRTAAFLNIQYTSSICTKSRIRSDNQTTFSLILLLATSKVKLASEIRALSQAKSHLWSPKCAYRKPASRTFSSKITTASKAAALSLVVRWKDVSPRSQMFRSSLGRINSWRLWVSKGITTLCRSRAGCRPFRRRRSRSHQTSAKYGWGRRYRRKLEERRVHRRMIIRSWFSWGQGSRRYRQSSGWVRIDSFMAKSTWEGVWKILQTLRSTQTSFIRSTISWPWIWKTSRRAFWAQSETRRSKPWCWAVSLRMDRRKEFQHTPQTTIIP